MKKKICQPVIVCVGISLMLWATAVAQFSQGTKFYKPLKVEHAPRIDGVLNEPEWSRAEKSDGFIDAHNIDCSAQEATEFMVLYDEQNLYIGIACRERRIKDLVAKCPAQSIFKDDCVEIFLDVAHDHINDGHLAVNCKGAKWAGDKKHGSDWDLKWDAKTSIGANYWYVEAALSFESLGARFGPSSLWGFNVCRVRYTEGAAQASGWRPFFNKPKQYGHLIGQPLLYLQQVFLPACRLRRDKMGAELSKSLKVSNKTVQDECRRMEAQIERKLAAEARRSSIAAGELVAVCAELESSLSAYDDLREKAKCPVFKLLF